MVDTKLLSTLRKQLLSPYKKYLLYNDKGNLVTINYDAFNADHKETIIADKIQLLSTMTVAAAIYRTIKELEDGA